MEEALEEVKQVVEGVYSAKAVNMLAKKYKVSMPIVEQICQVLFEGADVNAAIKKLLTRDRCMEYPDLGWLA